MFLLKYDIRHIRAFIFKNNKLIFSHFEDSLLPLSKYLFSTSSTIQISKNILNKCHCFRFALSYSPYKLILSFNHSLCIIFESDDQQIYFEMSADRAMYWKTIFEEDMENAPIYDSLNLLHPGKEHLIEFFHECGINIQKYLRIIDVYYEGDFFCLPLEFLSEHIIPRHFIKSENQNPKKSSSKIEKFSMIYDPDLERAHEESLKIINLLKLKQLELDMYHPDILMVSAHGLIDATKSFLPNETLEDLIDQIYPQIVIFNSCLLAQKSLGVIQKFLDKGSDVIASPFYTSIDKTIFGPLLRFLHVEGDMFYIFAIASLFYPRISKYFRYITRY